MPKTILVLALITVMVMALACDAARPPTVGASDPGPNTVIADPVLLTLEKMKLAWEIADLLDVSERQLVRGLSSEEIEETMERRLERFQAAYQFIDQMLERDAQLIPPNAAPEDWALGLIRLETAQ